MTDAHAVQRDRKRASKERSRLMRGNRSVFIIALAQQARDEKALRASGK